MKTPEETKKGLKCCIFGKCDTWHCPYDGLGNSIIACTGRLFQDTIEYIQQLEETVSEKEKVIAELLEKFEQLQRERDAAVKDLSMGLRCNACKKFFKNNNNVGCSGGLYCIPFRFEWRGICSENTNDDRSCLNCKHQGPEGRGICMDCNFRYSKYEPLENTEVQDED